jgi:hypothetical protein
MLSVSTHWEASIVLAGQAIKTMSHGWAAQILMNVHHILHLIAPDTHTALTFLVTTHVNVVQGFRETLQKSAMMLMNVKIKQ